MSIKTAEQFLELLAIKPSLRTQCYVISNVRTETDLARFAAGKGFLFSRTELEEALKNSPHASRIPLEKERIFA
jgi:hypothetical protein